ncbi:putative only prolin and serin are matching in the corresponding protein [Rosellinia necatrix]|uniref:Putative only prolin and serin are matching in the corresponding protein n=1 Tax=Rosellinia necatrix TaxID=77044 RepID=A0A1W2TK59_ROSNE|nr:putative only prolin and serin are matching in the corresponding protein [Rosellinia necatrix]
MSPGLRPLRLPLLVERRRKQEEAAAVAVTTTFENTDGDVLSPQRGDWQYQHSRHYTFTPTDSFSSEITSPVTPTFSARGHLRYSSSMSSFDLALPTTSCEDLPCSPTQVLQTPGKRALDDVVEEELFEYDRFNHYIKNTHVACDEHSEKFDLYDCLCADACTHREADLVRTTTSFYARGRKFESDLGCLSDSDSPASPRSSRMKQRNGSLPPFMGLSHRIGSRFPSLVRWKSPRKLSVVSSPASDMAPERRSTSRAASSRSSSVSRSNRYLPDRSNEPPLPPTPALSFFDSTDSITAPGYLDVDQADSRLSHLQRERAQATTPLLPPMMTGTCPDYAPAQPSPLQSPTIASPFDGEPQSPLLLSPPISSKPSISSFRQIMSSSDMTPFPEPDSWSDRLGHANFNILPAPYRPSVATPSSLRELRADWDTARVNYTKHLVRTGEHYGLTSKTYKYTEEKWAEIDITWRMFYEKTAKAVMASGEDMFYDKFDDNILTTVPIMDGEGKFPERGDEDIVGPMVREATMSSPTGSERRRPSFWRHLTDRVSLRK